MIRRLNADGRVGGVAVRSGFLKLVRPAAKGGVEWAELRAALARVLVRHPAARAEVLRAFEKFAQNGLAGSDLYAFEEFGLVGK